MRTQCRELRIDRGTVGVERRTHLFLFALHVAQRMIALCHSMPEIGEPVGDAVELALRLADHAPRLIELRRSCRRFARAGHDVQLRLVALFELLELIESAAHVALSAFLGVHCLTSLIERASGTLLLFDDRLESRHQGRKTLLQAMNLDVVVLHREQRGNVWMHSASVRLLSGGYENIRAIRVAKTLDSPRALAAPERRPGQLLRREWRE